MPVYQLDSPKQIEQVSNNLYLDALIMSPSLKNEDDMNKEVDRALTDPSQSQFLNNYRLGDFIQNVNEDDAQLILPENSPTPSSKKRKRFRKLKKKLKMVLCDIWNNLKKKDDKYSIKNIIKIAVNFIGKFFGGIPDLIRTILTKVAGYLINKGFEILCPMPEVEK